MDYRGPWGAGLQARPDTGRSVRKMRNALSCTSQAGGVVSKAALRINLRGLSIWPLGSTSAFAPDDMQYDQTTGV
jgi:hypothetical protein